MLFQIPHYTVCLQFHSIDWIFDMHNVLSIFKSDITHLHRSFWAIVVVVFMLVLPAMYAWVNIYANWDPYGNTGGVKIAVVSNDRDYVADDGTVKNVGDDVIESLKSKTSIGWQFLDSADEALNGVYDGTYYAAIIIDKNFTYNMYNFLTTDMTQPTIRYYVNSKTNAIATKITDTAASTIKATVNENYLKVIIETIFSKLNGLYQNIESDDPISSLEDVLNSVNNNLANYSSTLAAFTQAGNMLQNDLAGMNKTIDYAIYTINNSRDHLANQVQDVESAQGELAAVNNEVNTSLTNISNLLQKAINQIDGKDISSTTTVTATMEELEKQYSELITYLETRGGETSNSTADALSALKQNAAQMEALRKSLGLNNNFTADDQAYLQATETKQALTGLQSDFQNAIVPDLYKSYVDSSANSVLEANASSEATLQSMSEFMLQDVSAKLDSIEANANTAATATDPAVAAAAEAQMREDAASASGELQALGAAYAAISKQVPSVDTAKLQAATSTAASQISSIASNITFPDIKTMLEANKLAVDSTREALTQDVYPALNTALDNVKSTMGDMSSVLMNLGDVLTNTKPVISAMGSAVNSLNNAFASMQKVMDSVSKQITDVLKAIDDMKNDEKIQTLLDFFGLDPDSIGSFLAQPVETVTEPVYPVENYGSGMTPFYSTLAIWVGSVILCAVLSTAADPAGLIRPKAWQLYFGRYLTFLFYALLQSAVIILGDMYLLGCQCLHPWLFILSGFVTAFAFSTLIYSLTMSFGDVGKAIVVIIMIIQIAGSSGSFPIELLPTFFQKVYIFFPFPYAINAMRECIAGMYKLYYWHCLLDLQVFVAAGLFIGLVIRKPFIGLTEYIEEKAKDTQVM
jgi:putative membrane protein